MVRPDTSDELVLALRDQASEERGSELKEAVPLPMATLAALALSTAQSLQVAAAAGSAAAAAGSAAVGLAPAAALSAAGSLSSLRTRNPRHTQARL
jgi:hypothetical protein